MILRNIGVYTIDEANRISEQLRQRYHKIQPLVNSNLIPVKQVADNQTLCIEFYYKKGTMELILMEVRPYGIAEKEFVRITNKMIDAIVDEITSIIGA